MLSNVLYLNTAKISTNDLIREYKEINGYCIVANHQLNGRGRYGKKFVVKKNQAIILSIIFNSFNNFSDPAFKVATIIQPILQKYLNDKITIKKPNDLMINNQKLGGILVEKLIIGSKEYLIIGIGINYSGVPESSQLDFMQPITYLSNMQNQLKKTKQDIILQIIENLRKIYEK